MEVHVTCHLRKNEWKNFVTLATVKENSCNHGNNECDKGYAISDIMFKQLLID